MERDELLKQSVAMVNRVISLRNCIKLCGEAIKILSGQPQIVIHGDYGRVVLDNPVIGLDRESREAVSKGIAGMVTARQEEMEKTLEAVLEAVENVFQRSEGHPLLVPKTFGPMSPDDVDF